MGSQVTVVIRTDAIHEIQENAQEFVNNLIDATYRVAAGYEPTDFAAGHHANPGQVVAYNHCDMASIIYSGGARGKQLALIANSDREDDRTRAKRVIIALMNRYRITGEELT